MKYGTLLSIPHNVLALGAVAEIEAENYLQALNLNRKTKLNINRETRHIAYVLVVAGLFTNQKEMNTKELKAVLSKIEKAKEKIAKERDVLRELYDDLESLLDSFDRGIEAIENGKLEIENGIDAISEVV